MKTIKILGVAIAVIATSTTSIASENSSASENKAEQKITQYINGNLFGIQNVKKDANKRIISLVSTSQIG